MSLTEKLVEGEAKKRSNFVPVSDHIINILCW